MRIHGVERCKRTHPTFVPRTLACWFDRSLFWNSVWIRHFGSEYFRSLSYQVQYFEILAWTWNETVLMGWKFMSSLWMHSDLEEAWKRGAICCPWWVLWGSPGLVDNPEQILPNILTVVIVQTPTNSFFLAEPLSWLNNCQGWMMRKRAYHQRHQVRAMHSTGTCARLGDFVDLHRRHVI